jgi:hypothetical protein
MGEMKNDVELTRPRMTNCWCQKTQVIGILCDHLLPVCLSRM